MGKKLKRRNGIHLLSSSVEGRRAVSEHTRQDTASEHAHAPNTTIFAYDVQHQNGALCVPRFSCCRDNRISSRSIGLLPL